MEVWRGLLPGGFPPGRREQEVGFLSARENRSRARACTRNQPRACGAGRRHKHGARIAHRRCACVRGWAQAKTRCANCPPQVRVRARLGAGKNTVRELLGAAARACAAFSSYLSPFPVWLFPLKILFICRSCRDGHPIFFSERKWGKRTAMGRDSAPFEPPFQRPAADLPFPRAAGRLSGPLGRKPPADKGKRLKSQGAKLSFSSVSVRWGRAGAFARRVSSRPQGTGDRIPACPGKQEPGMGLHPERTAGVRGPNAATNTVRELLGAAARLARRGPTLENNRGRARHGEEKDTVRVLLTAGVPAAGVLTAGARARETGRRDRQGAPICGRPMHYVLQRG